MESILTGYPTIGGAFGIIVLYNAEKSKAEFLLLLSGFGQWRGNGFGAYYEQETRCLHSLDGVCRSCFALKKRTYEVIGVTQDRVFFFVCSPMNDGYRSEIRSTNWDFSEEAIVDSINEERFFLNLPNGKTRVWNTANLDQCQSSIEKKVFRPKDCRRFPNGDLVGKLLRDGNDVFFGGQKAVLAIAKTPSAKKWPIRSFR